MSEPTRGITGVTRRPAASRILAKNRPQPPAIDTAEDAQVPNQAPAVPELTEQPTTKVPAARASTPVPDVSDAVGYQDFPRKEARLRDGQLEELERHARRLQRAKTTKGTPRITENTLIRIGIDLLLAQADQLRGSTEEELRKSVGL